MRRIVSAAVLLAVAFVVTRYLPPLAFFLMIVFIVALGVHEFCALAGRRGLVPQFWSAAVGSVLLAYSFFDPRLNVLEVLALVMLGLPLLSLMRADALPDKFGNLAMTLFPVIFLGLLLGYIVALRVLPGEDGHDLPFLLLLVVAAADTGAYYGGRLLGRRLMAPRVSPNKTWEGLLAGMACAVAAAFLAKGWFMHRLAVRDCVVLGILLAAIGAAGDLVESALKRWAGAKNSSTLIPGHGGILDRIDALMFAAPVLFYYHLQFMRGLTP
jgi:phosphatidate cytidylyltransferase